MLIENDVTNSHEAISKLSLHIHHFTNIIYYNRRYDNCYSSKNENYSIIISSTLILTFS